MDIFNIQIEFNHDVFRKAIEECVKNNAKGYVCVVDGNVLTMVQKDLNYRKIVQQATFNTCDGS